MSKLVIENLYKSFPSKGKRNTPVNVLRSINLTVEPGEFLILVGPSGCGKSTLLRIIAGLEELGSGNISLGEKLLNHLPPNERDIAMVFQNYALYPHLKVYDNIAFGLRRLGEYPSTWQEDLKVGITRTLPGKWYYCSEKEKQIEKQVKKVAELLQIEHLLERMPKELSGGQKQRVALGRAIARNPKLFLMDEPLSNLDAQLRSQTRASIVRLQKQLGITTIYVTHDQVEAMTMGDRLAVMNQGELQQLGTPMEVYNQPANIFVAQFIGSPPMNLLKVQLVSPLLITAGQFRLTLDQKRWEEKLSSYEGKWLYLGIRPEHLNISPAAPKNLQVQVDSIEALGHDTYVQVHLVEDANTILEARISPQVHVQVGEILWLSMNVEKLYLFDSDTENVI